MAFSLEKNQEAAETRLRSRGFKVLKDDPRGGFMARMMVAMDGSGSTQTMWLNGTMQGAIQLVLPPALAVDDDGKLPVAVFNAGSDFTLLDDPMTRGNYASYVEDRIVTRTGRERVPIFGGTDYSPVIRAILKTEGFIVDKAAGWLSKAKTEIVAKPNNCPTVLYFFTDGACSGGDERSTHELLCAVESAGCRAYVLFIGVGRADFGFIKRLADERGNVGFASVEDLAATTRADAARVTELLLPDELLDWCKKAK